ncbi:alpha/beta hydrolase [Dactylosporangium sp. AC04546]|uniref:alpha/beta fold hydrolase n=1 Tax=Dactylosporangium sp. AC04546 TaxID=2862460 RepID=UPI001EDFE26A|nr:alpha/beta hydrolase [Dactylosporangium sp. AC04546]WVK81351.1 alpha/beta hydrolase [Dactylosporangium sp. AC04546]
MTEVRLHDGNRMTIEVHGDGPAVLLPVNPTPADGAQADELRRWGADPALGRTLIDGLADGYRVVAFDYEGHVLGTPKPDTLTPDALAADLLAVADAAGVERFAYYGYSWLAVAGLQLALRTDRLTGLAMGGYPPVGGPYAAMLKVTAAAHAAATDPQPAPAGAGDGDDWSSAEFTLSEAQTRQFVTLYEALRYFDDRAAQGGLTIPRLCLVGSADSITYDERWGGVTVDLAGPVVAARAELEALGWAVTVFDGLDHMGAMQAVNVLPVLRPWLDHHLR